MRYLTAGESHGPRLTAIIEGVPAGLPLTADYINVELKRRQGGYGRGARMKIESDQVEITSGVRHGLTMGGPITLNVTNLDHQKWLEIMSVSDVEEKKKGLRKITNLVQATPIWSVASSTVSMTCEILWNAHPLGNEPCG